MNSKKIVILTNYFPPHNIVGARRPYYFAKYLSELGNEVTVITSKTTDKTATFWQPDNLTFNFRVIYVKKETYTDNFIYSKLKKLTEKKANDKSFRNKILRNIAILFLPVDFENRLIINIKEVAAKIGKADFIIASGPPWSQFLYGKELGSILESKLILDYRDPWTIINDEVSVDVLNNYGSGLAGFLKKIKNQLAEYRFTKSAIAFVTVSEPILANSSIITSINNGRVIYNGFDTNEVEGIEIRKNEKFEISFTGIIREEMNISCFLKALETILSKNNELRNNLKINFIGSNMPGTEEVIKKIIDFKYFKEVVNLTSFVDKKKAIEIQKNSNLLLILSYASTMGIMSSKIFQYLEAKRPILLVSNTEDVMENLIRKTNSGFICKTENEISETVLSSFKLWQNNGSIPYEPNISEIEIYSFRNQVSLLNDFMNEL